MPKYISGNRKDKLVLLEDNLHVIAWYVEASSAIKTNFKSHTGGIMTLGGGNIQYISHKKKLNTQSSTEAKLFSSKYASTMIIWSLLFLKYQGCDIDKNIL